MLSAASTNINFYLQVIEDGMPAKPDSRCPEDMFTVMRSCWVKVHEFKTNLFSVDLLLTSDSQNEF